MSRNKVPLFFASGLIFCALLSQEAIKDNMQAASNLREEVAKNSKVEMSLMASQQHQETQAQIARQRYERGCLRVKGYLQSGEPVWKNNRPLPAGTVVCDDHGNTGVLIPADFDRDNRLNAVVGQIAFAGNPPALVEETTPIRYVR